MGPSCMHDRDVGGGLPKGSHLKGKVQGPRNFPQKGGAELVGANNIKKKYQYGRGEEENQWKVQKGDE